MSDTNLVRLSSEGREQFEFCRREMLRAFTRFCATAAPAEAIEEVGTTGRAMEQIYMVLHDDR